MPPPWELRPLVRATLGTSLPQLFFFLLATASCPAVALPQTVVFFLKLGNYNDL
jgi:hypothetical protein